MVYVPKDKLKDFQRGVNAWNRFKEIAKELARLNAQILKSKEARRS